MTNRNIRLLAGASVLALALSATSAIAQSSTSVDELIVTGSRIPRANIEQPTPIATLDSRDIRNAGTSSLGDIISLLPAMASSGTVRANSDSGANVGGLSFPDLRGLGTSRTLTLVNGKRHVAGDAGDQAVDLNSIPTALVERVEVITGGASAVYGSDAVSGVVNIILKDKFVGYEVGLQGGSPLNGNYGQNYSGYATGGWNFAGDKGNVTLSVFGDKQERVTGPRVKGLKDWATIENPADTGIADGVPDRLYAPYVQSDVFGDFGIIVSPDYQPITSFDASGRPVPVPGRTGTNNLFFGSFAEDCLVCSSSDRDAVIVPRFARYGLASTFNYQIAPSVRFTADAKYVHSRVLDTFSPSFTTFEYGLDPDNAFITPAIQSVLDANPQDFYYVNRTNRDIGGRNDSTTRETYRIVGGFDGQIDAGFADLKWEASYNYGQTKNKFHSTGGLIPGNFFAAIDAVVDPSNGQIRCRKDVPATWYPGYSAPDPDILTNEGCVPFNLFGQQNSQAAKDYVSYEGDRTHTITQQVASGSFTFDTSRFLNLPGGPLGFAVGAEYRKETSKNINDPFVQSGITETAPQPNASGGFNVKEGFIEARAPLLANQPFFHQLELEGAVRFADYSHAGKATSYKVGGQWAPIQDITFRGTYSRAVRAPNITEAFLPATAGFNSIFDPCDAADRDENPNRAANCARLGANFTDALNNQFPGVTSGNENLTPEKAKTWTVGIVLQPRAIPGLTVTVDYYDIVIKDAIDFLSPQDAADKCVDGPELSEQYCGLILRDGNAQIVSYISSYLNTSALKTAGYDIEVAYARDLGPGRIQGKVTANYIEKLREFAFQDFPDTVDRQEAELGNPRWSFITSLSYQQGPVTMTWNSQYTSQVRRNKESTLERSDRPYVNSVWYHDLIGSYNFENIGRGTEVYLGVRNIFDKNIPLGISGNTPTTASYDIFGRYLFAGVTARF